MSDSLQERSNVAEEAAWWLHRLKQDHGPEVQAEFSRWIRKAAIHLEEFLFAQAIWRELDGIDPGLRGRYQDSSETRSVVEFPSPHTAVASSVGTTTAAQPEVFKARGRRRGWRAAAAIAAIITGAAVIGLSLPFGKAVYTTGVGEQRIIKLADGSVMRLNTRTRAETLYGKGLREIRLRDGEAMFTVERDPSRPFVVVTDSAQVQALGTEFNVYRRPEGGTQVSVVSGAVQVTVPGKETGAPVVPGSGSSGGAIRLSRGDEAQVVRGHIVRTKVPDVSRATAWRARQLVFSGQPVAEIVSQFNRYNKIPIRVEGETLREHRMNGVFAADDPTPFLRFLSKEPGVAVVREGGEIVIRETDATP